MLKNIDRVEQYLIEIGYVQQAMAEHTWLKQYDTIDCCVDLSTDTLKMEWYPHGDYSKKSSVLKDQPILKELKTVLQNVSKSNHLPPIFEEPDAKATEDSVPNNQKDPAPLSEEHPTTPSDGVAGSSVPTEVKSSIPMPSFVSGMKPAPSAKKPVQGSLDAGIDKKKDEVIPPPALPVPLELEPKQPLSDNVPEIYNPKKTDAELDRMMSDAKAEKWLTDRGESYKVHNKERPDAASIQRVSNKHGVSIEIISAVQTGDYAEVIVRAHLGTQYIDAVVHHDLVNYRRILILEMINKHPEILDYWNGEMPVLKVGSTIKDQGGKIKDAKYSVMHSYFTFVQFCLRDAVTKAAAAAQAKILNQDWQEKEDVESEQFEVNLVNGR